MADSKVQTTVGQVEKGTRIRTVHDRDVLMGNSVPTNHKIYFDNFAIDLKWNANQYNCSVSIVGFLSSSVTPVQLETYFSSYTVDFDLRVVDSEKEYVKAQFLFNNSKSRTQPLNIPSLYAKYASIEIKFNMIDGLCVQPLRDYSISTDVSDITLVVEKQRFQLNRGFLASLSSYFERLFFWNSEEKNRDEIVLKDISADTFTDLLDVLHQELHPIHNKEKLFALLKLADQWDVPSVIAKVQTSFKLYPTLLRLNVGEKLWMFDRFHMTMFLHESLVGWQKSYSSYMTEEMFNELSDATKFSIFKKFA